MVCVSVGCSNTATQFEETEDICMVVMNEKTGNKEIIRSNGIGVDNTTPYSAQQGDSFFIPIRDNITDIFYSTAETQAKTLYSIDSVGVDYSIVETSNNLNVIEVISDNETYNISIGTTDTEEYTAFIILNNN